MSENTKIEWCDHTFNPWIGCTKVGPGCDNCYAEAWDRRFAVSGHTMRWGADKPRTRTKTWRDPVKWNKQADAFFAENGRRQRVFCASLADVFDNAVEHKWRADLMALIRDTPNLDWLLLTKRIGNAIGMLNRADDDLRCPLRKPAPDQGFEWPLANVWLGATIVNQEEADRDIPKLLAVPAAKRFLSMEPLLGPVDLQSHLWVCCGCPEPGGGGDGFMQPPDPPSCCGNPEPSGIDWVIVGGESGNTARPMHPDWARDLRDQCEKAGVPFLFKQWGEWATTATDTCHPDSYRIPGNLCSVQHSEEPQNYYSAVSLDGQQRYRIDRVGKKAAGRLLDGRTWDGFPS